MVACVLGCLQMAVADPGLESAEKAAVQTNPSILAAWQQREQAQQKVREAEAQGRPAGQLRSQQPGAARRRNPAPADEETFTAVQNSLTVNLPPGDRPRLAVLQAQAQMDAATAQFKLSERALLDQVDSAYYDVLRNQALLQTALDTQTEATRQLQDATRRHAAGDVAQLDVLRAQVPEASARAGVLQAANTLDIARETFNSLVGSAPEASIELVDDAEVSNAPAYTLQEARDRVLSGAPRCWLQQPRCMPRRPPWRGPGPAPYASSVSGCDRPEKWRSDRLFATGQRTGSAHVHPVRRRPGQRR